MAKFLPLIFLSGVFSIFGLVWIFWYTDPDSAPFYIFALVVGLVFAAIMGIIGTIIYFIRAKVYRRLSSKSNFISSFKLVLIFAVTISFLLGLRIAELLSKFNLFLTICALVLFSFWSYLGKKIEKD